MQSSNVRLTAEEVAAYFAERAPALKQHGGEWRGPKWLKLGSAVRYELAEVERWMRASERGPEAV